MYVNTNFAYSNISHFVEAWKNRCIILNTINLIYMIRGVRLLNDLLLTYTLSHDWLCNGYNNDNNEKKRACAIPLVCGSSKHDS